MEFTDSSSTQMNVELKTRPKAIQTLIEEYNVIE